jgi:predicted DNA binding protein
MLDKIIEMMKAKKNYKELDPKYKQAKINALEALRAEMMDHMKGDLTKAPLAAKVTVAASSEECLKEGLEKAKEMLGTSAEPEVTDEAKMDSKDHVDQVMKEFHGEKEDEPVDHKGLTPEEMETLKLLLKKMK